MRVVFTFCAIGILFCLEFNLCSSAVSVWGERCNFTAECSDHRMVCEMDSSNVTICVCDRFHEWKGRSEGCILSKFEAIMESITSTDNKAKLERDQQTIYIGHKVAGFFVMGVALVCPVIVAIHCCHMKKKDRVLKADLRLVKERVEEAKKRREYRRAGNMIV